VCSQLFKMSISLLQLGDYQIVLHTEAHSQSAHVVNKLFSRYSQLPFGTPSRRMRSCRLNEFCSFASEKRKIMSRCVCMSVCGRCDTRVSRPTDFSNANATFTRVLLEEKCGRALTSHAFLSDVRGLIFYCALSSLKSKNGSLHWTCKFFGLGAKNNS
jgi:hypothetical protein